MKNKLGSMWKNIDLMLFLKKKNCTRREIRLPTCSTGMGKEKINGKGDPFPYPMCVLLLKVLKV